MEDLTLNLEDLNLTAELSFDEDGYPEFCFETQRPFEVHLNDVLVHGVGKYPWRVTKKVMSADVQSITVTFYRDHRSKALCVTIDTNDNYTGDHYRPALALTVNGTVVHEMFDAEDTRWGNGAAEVEDAKDS